MLYDDARNRLGLWQPTTQHLRELRRRYLAHLDAYPDAMTRGSFPAHLTASALVLNSTRTHALLTLHAKARQWFQLGGHCEPTDTTLAAAAMREATEESGIEGLSLDPVPFFADDHEVPFCGDWPTPVHHYDVWFLITAPDQAQPTVSEESLQLLWWPLTELPGDSRAWEPALAALAERLSG